MGGPNEVRAKFPSMEEGTQEDWQIIGSHFGNFASKVADRVLDHLKLLDGDFGGFPIDRMQHSLQTATRAHRDGRDEQYVVMAAFFRAIISSTISAWTATCANSSEATSILKIALNFAQSTTRRPLMRPTIQRRSSFSNRWFAA